MLNIPERNPPARGQFMILSNRAACKSRSIIFAFTTPPVYAQLDNKLSVMTMLIFSNIQKKKK